MPGYLKQQVLQLNDQHTVTELSQTLGLKLSTLKRWQDESRSPSKNVKAPPIPKPLEFITIAPPTYNLEPLISEPVSLTVELPSGIRLILSGKSSQDCVEWVVLLQERMQS